MNQKFKYLLLGIFIGLTLSLASMFIIGFLRAIALSQ
jgi:hypothetical protein